MTVNGVQNIIVQLLGNQDIVSLSEIKLQARKYLKDEKLLEKLINLAIEKLIPTGLIQPLDKDFWVLTKPLTSFPQNIEIDGVLAAGIATVLNKAASLVAEESIELCNALAITSQDIETLMLIADNINRRNEGDSDETPVNNSGDDVFKLP